MRLRVLAFWCVLVLGGSLEALAQQQQPTGPATIEGPPNSSAAEKPAATDEADEVEAGPKRPAGTVTRPKDGVQHPDLDKAWADYDAAVAKATESIKATIAKQFDAATTKGDLDGAEKWQIALEKFETTGGLPTEKEAKTAVSAATADYKKAREELAAAYEAVIKSLTMEKKIVEAKTVRGEFLAIDKKVSDSTAEGGTIDGRQPSKTRKKEAVFLADLQERDVVVGWGRYGKNGDLGFEPWKIVVRGQEISQGISMSPKKHGIAKASFDIPAGLTTFEAVAAINDTAEQRQPSPVVFKVLGDEKVIWQSPPLQGGGATANCKVRLMRAKVLTLLVECPGTNQRAHAVWCNPRLTSE